MLKTNTAASKGFGTSDTVFLPEKEQEKRQSKIDWVNLPNKSILNDKAYYYI